jgi:magnesium transporter
MCCLYATRVLSDTRFEELLRLLQRRDAVVWVDIPVCDQQAVNVLSDVFGFHPIAVRDCIERNHRV